MKRLVLACVLASLVSIPVASAGVIVEQKTSKVIRKTDLPSPDKSFGGVGKVDPPSPDKPFAVRGRATAWPR